MRSAWSTAQVLTPYRCPDSPTRPLWARCLFRSSHEQGAPSRLVQPADRNLGGRRVGAAWRNIESALGTPGTGTLAPPRCSESGIVRRYDRRRLWERGKAEGDPFPRPRPNDVFQARSEAVRLTGVPASESFQGFSRCGRPLCVSAPMAGSGTESLDVDGALLGASRVDA